MKVKCITRSQRNFTVGKEYEVLGVYDKTYSLVDDCGKEQFWWKEYFTITQIIEEKQEMTTQFKDMKIRINSPEHSKKVQDYLRDIGYKDWKGAYLDYQYSDLTGLFVYDTGFVDWNSDDLNYFNRHNNPEFTLEESITYSLKETPKPIVETIEIGGVFYAKSEVENALKNLKAIV